MTWSLLRQGLADSFKPDITTLSWWDLFYHSAADGKPMKMSSHMDMTKSLISM